MNIRSGSAPRSPLPAAVEAPERSSAVIQTELDQLDAKRTEAAERLVELEQEYAAVLLLDDDQRAAEHEAAVAATKRIIARADLRRPVMEVALKDAQEREATARKAAVQAEAAERRDAFLQTGPDRYRRAAEQVAAFLAEWQAVERQCEAVGIETPAKRLRHRPASREPDRVETRHFFVDLDGTEHGTEFPAGTYTDSPRGKLLNGRPVEESRRERQRREQVVPGRVIPAFSLPPIESLVALPEIEIGGEPFWPRPKA